MREDASDASFFPHVLTRLLARYDNNDDEGDGQRKRHHGKEGSYIFQHPFFGGTHKKP